MHVVECRGRCTACHRAIDPLTSPWLYGLRRSGGGLDAAVAGADDFAVVFSSPSQQHSPIVKVTGRNLIDLLT